MEVWPGAEGRTNGRSNRAAANRERIEREREGQNSWDGGMGDGARSCGHVSNGREENLNGCASVRQRSGLSGGSTGGG